MNRYAIVYLSNMSVKFFNKDELQEALTKERAPVELYKLDKLTHRYVRLEQRRKI